MPIFTLREKSMPSTNSRKPWTKCCRDCSPSVTMSNPASSCALSQSSVASRFVCSSSPATGRQAGQSLRGSASQAGFGRLPAMVVLSIRFPPSRLLWPFMAWLRTAPFAIGVLAAGCAVPPERTERELALRSAIGPCVERYPTVKLTGIDEYGRVYARASEHDNVDGFEQCSREAIERQGLALIGTGKLAGSAAAATVPIRSAYSAFLVPVQVNGVSATLILDTG